MDRSDKALALLVLVAVVAAILPAAGRARIERANRTVEIVIDADDARLVAFSSGTPLASLLAELNRAGAGALAIREMTVGDLAGAGRVMAMSIAGETNIITPDGELAGQLAPALAARLPQTSIEVSAPPWVLTVGMPADRLRDVPGLLRPEDIEAARLAGLRPVARLRNFPGATTAAVDAACAEAAGVGARLVIFDRDEVLGFDGLIGDTARALERNDLLFGFVEMAAQRGEMGLARRARQRLVRVHSVSEGDMLTMTPGVGAPRYARAVQERNVRVVYLRLLTRPRADLAGSNVRYVGAVANALRRQGFTPGPPAPFSAPRGWPPRWARALAALGALAGAVLALRRFLPLPAAWTWGLFAAGSLAGLAIGAARPAMVAPLGGLAAAIAFPTLATVWAVQGARGAGLRPGLGSLIGPALWRLLAASAVSFAGAMLVVGLYSQVTHLSGIALFTGVKMSLVVPLALVLAAVFADLGRPIEQLPAWWIRARLRTAALLRQPLTVLHAGLVLAALVALAFAVSRSGNQPVLSPSGLEMRARQALEAVLVVRPRTKEFLLGHPMLMLGVALGRRGRRSWLPLVAALGAFGQVSLVNTFCHFHTPLHVSLLRTANGLWIGALMGVFAILVWRAVLDRPLSRPS